MTAQTWRVVAASTQGVSHRASKTPCQDAHGYRWLGENGLLLSVADGAGSAERSQEGARCAVESALATLAAALDGGIPSVESEWMEAMRQAFAAARAALEQLASADGAPLRSFATTLTCAVLSGDWLAVGQIGDGALVARLADGALLTAIIPQRGEYANEAYFLTMPEAMQYVDLWAQPCAPLGVAATTDGLLRLALQLPGYEPHPPFFAPLWAFAASIEDESEEQAAQELSAFLDSERVCARSDDDKTLLLAVRRTA